MYLLPQEIEVWYIIPAIRKELAKLLTQQYEMSYEQAGNVLGVSKAAISQYLSNKRANKVKLSVEVKKEIEKSAKIIAKDQKNALGEMQRILRYIKIKKCLCTVCKKYNKNVLNYCGYNSKC